MWFKGLLILQLHDKSGYMDLYTVKMIFLNICILIIYLLIHTGSLLHTLTGHLGVVRCLHINKFRLVSGGDQKKINVWDYRVCIKTIILWSTGCV